MLLQNEALGYYDILLFFIFKDIILVLINMLDTGFSSWEAIAIFIGVFLCKSIISVCGTLVGILIFSNYFSAFY